MHARMPLVVGNWKSNGSTAFADALFAQLVGAALPEEVQVAVCPPHPYLVAGAAKLAGSNVMLGAQDVSEHPGGAYTGEVSAAMLVDVGCRYVIVGHSERRALLGETDARVAVKAERARAAGLIPIVCVGETLEQRDAGQTEAVIANQIDAVAAVLGSAPAGTAGVAYEPVWAIGTGRSATPEQAQAVHRFIRTRLRERGVAQADEMPLLYGGSVKPSNAGSLFEMADIDGGLIGGASLSAGEFIPICQAAAARR